MLMMPWSARQSGSGHDGAGKTGVQHGALGVLLRGFGEHGIRLKIHHVMQKAQPFVEGNIGLGRAGRLEVDISQIAIGNSEAGRPSNNCQQCE